MVVVSEGSRKNYTDIDESVKILNNKKNEKKRRKKQKKCEKCIERNNFSSGRDLNCFGFRMH